MPDIDSLSIQLSSDASKAEQAIDSLVNKLGTLKVALDNVAPSFKSVKFGDAATGMNKFASAVSRIDAKRLDMISASLSKLSFVRLFTGNGDQFASLSAGLSQLGRVKIGTAAKQLPTLVTALRGLNGVKVPATDIADLGRALGKLGSSNAQKAITNMPQLANAFKQLVADLSNLPSINNNVVQLAQAFATLAQHGNQVGNIMRFTSGTFGGIGTGAIRATSGVNILKKSMDSMHNSINGILGKITRLTAGFLSIRSVFNVLKDSVEVASAITEVQNVVDKTFGETRVKLEDFAKTAVSSYGMSELTAKKIASQFQAMGATVGLTTQQIGDAHEFLSDRIHEAYQVENAEMADMSVNLTRLTSDMASFYDVSQEDVATKLQAIFTGASRPLRQFGIDLTQATLQEWALKHGIDAEVKSMSQAEKVMLRYMYVMDRTAVAQGDFADTIGSWHNQVTLLTEGFKQLKAIVGQGLINMFRPFLMSLNSAMNTAIDLVQKAFNAMGKLLGWQIEIEDVQGSLGYVGSDFDSEDEMTEADVSEADDAADDVADTTEELADAADSAEDVGDGMNDAAEGAKELKRQIMSFDELHTLADNSEDVAKALKESANSVPKVKDPKDSAKAKDKDSDSKDDASEAYADGLEEGTITGGNVTFKPYESSIESWFGFGRAISDTLAQAMEDINWEQIYNKARNFGKGLADFLNGLITPRTFADLGHTIAGALNTALNFLNSFGHNFDWKNLGDSIAAEVNEFFRTFDFGLLADTMNTWAHGLLDALIRWLEKTDWDLIGERIGEFLEALDFTGIGKKIGKAIWLAINAGFKVFKNMFEAAPLETALLTLVTVAGALKTKPIADFALALSNAVKKVNIFFTALGNGSGVVGALVTAFPGLTKVVEALSTAVATFKISLANSKNVVKAFFEGVESLGTFMTPVTKAVIGIAGAAADLIITKDATADIAHNLFEGDTNAGNLLANIGKIGGAFALAGTAFTPIFGFPGGLIAAGITSAIGAFMGLREEVEKKVDYTIWEGIMGVLSQPGGTPVQDLTQHYVDTFAAISSGFATIAGQSADIDTLKQSVADTNEQIGLIAFGIENGVEVTGKKVTELIGLYNDLYAQTKQIMDEQYNVIVRGISGAMGDSLEAVGTSSAEVIAAIESVKNQYESEVGGITAELDGLKTAFNEGKISQEEYKNAAKPLVDRLRELTGDTSEFETAVNNMSATINGIDFQSMITEVDGVNQIDMTALRDQIDQVGTSYTNAKNDVDTALQGMQEATRTYVNAAKSMEGNEGNLDTFAKLMESNAASAKQANDDLKDNFDAYADTIQTAVLHDLPDVIDQASKEYDNLNPLVKLFTPGGKEAYIEKSVATYKSEVIDPIEGELQAAYNQFGIDGTTWVSDAYGEISKAMYDENVIRNALGDSQRVEYVISDVASDKVRKALEMTDYKSHWEKAGKDSASGYKGGLDEGQDDVEKAAGSLMDAGINGAKDALDSHSPSKIYWNIGKDTIDGYNSGIDDNKDTTTTSITSWMNEASEIVKRKWEEFTNWWKNTGFKNWWDNDVAANFTQDKWSTLGENMKSGLTGKWSEITSWWDNNVVSFFRNTVYDIQNMFNGISFNMPQITLPHIVLDGWNDLGLLTVPDYHIEWYEKGGFIEDGLFTMNQGEMAGKFSNGTSVVANNQMITDSISSAVERAIVQQLPGIIETAVSRADTGGDVYIGDEQIYMASKRGEARANKRYSPSIAY